MNQMGLPVKEQGGDGKTQSGSPQNTKAASLRTNERKTRKWKANRKKTTRSEVSQGLVHGTAPSRKKTDPNQFYQRVYGRDPRDRKMLHGEVDHQRQICGRTPIRKKTSHNKTSQGSKDLKGRRALKGHQDHQGDQAHLEPKGHRVQSGSLGHKGRLVHPGLKETKGVEVIHAVRGAGYSTIVPTWMSLRVTIAARKSAAIHVA
jgi:hypothetical protein